MKSIIYLTCFFLVSIAYAGRPIPPYDFKKIPMDDAKQILQDGKDPYKYPNAVYTILHSDLPEEEKVKQLNKLFYDNKRHRRYTKTLYAHSYRETLEECIKTLKDPSSFILGIMEQDYFSKSKFDPIQDDDYPLIYITDVLDKFPEMDRKLQEKLATVFCPHYEPWFVALVAKYCDDDLQQEYFKKVKWSKKPFVLNSYYLKRIKQYNYKPAVYEVFLRHYFSDDEKIRKVARRYIAFDSKSTHINKIKPQHAQRFIDAFNKVLAVQSKPEYDLDKSKVKFLKDSLPIVKKKHEAYEKSKKEKKEEKKEE